MKLWTHCNEVSNYMRRETVPCRCRISTVSSAPRIFKKRLDAERIVQLLADNGFLRPRAISSHAGFTVVFSAPECIDYDTQLNLRPRRRIHYQAPLLGRAPRRRRLAR
jgi:hypothetical protein